jgi:hypothetical protein
MMGFWCKNRFAGSTFKIYVDDILSLPIGEIMKAGGSDDAPRLGNS